MFNLIWNKSTIKIIVVLLKSLKSNVFQTLA